MTVCTNVGLIDAVGLWWSGNKLDEYCLYGFHSLWISRIAKIAGFVGTLTILMDLIGEERILGFLNRISGKLSIVRDRLRSSITERTSDIRLVKDPRARAGRLLDTLSIPLSIFVFPPLIFYLHGQQILAYYISLGHLGQAVTLFLFGIILFLVLRNCLVSLPDFVDITTKPIELFFGNKRVCWAIRLLSAMLIVNAFWIDLLTS